MIDLSVVIPVRNEEPSVRELHRELSDVLAAFGREYEIIIVDDGSTDRTFPLLGELQALDPHLRVIQLRRNFGQTAAFAAGVDH
ncbi:MAG TPA: glycosyltransferase, partial [Vicinamibacterales bacterium]|nr:glycosyltransferase [Vicinamibacterales bacterium]